MKQKFLSLVSYGIKPETPPAVAEQIRLLNGISILGIPVVAPYALFFFIMGYHLLALVFAVGILIFTAPIFINKWFGINIGRVFTFLLVALFFGLISVLTGHEAGFYLGFVVISVPPVLLYPSIRKGFIFVGFMVICLLCSMYLSMNTDVSTALPFPMSMVIYMINLFSVLFVTLGVVYIFKNELSESRTILAEKNKEIVDSINYAQKIQFTLLAHEELLQKHLQDHFVLFKPKSIVSGDFYWAIAVGNSAARQTKKLDESLFAEENQHQSQNTDLFYLAVCDSTGHGVPGAFMSLLNISFINEAITEKNILEPHEIFNHARLRLTENLGKDGQKDGFDGILVCFNSAEKTITYSAANNAPLLFTNNGIMELKKDKMPVGVSEKKEGFTTYSLQYNPGDILYLYTDGYADQFGGPKGKKFRYKALNELIQTIAPLSMREQKEILNNTLENWMGSLEQIDDVCVIGIRL
ncbi:MAG: SpoIIE family protein phosphatase [Crocinitomicaceae bacterium]|nr:SpoIIE family protein phosphatase [Crocinitomicaceae bacterium]MBK8927134.1 SpoIIE family protein phosphatase [Crocinitomicaceae bacterium]